MAEVNLKMVERVAGKIRELPLNQVGALDFTEEDKFPAVDDPGALNYFFAVTMHDYGFWIGDERGYIEPLYGEVDGKRLKGSDLLWTLSMETYRNRGSEFFHPANLAKLEFEEFTKWLPEKCGFQDLMSRYWMTSNYANYIVSRKSIYPVLYPENIVWLSNQRMFVLTEFLRLTKSLPGYDQDRLLKKNLLLAMILANCPEKFLKIGVEEKWPPIIDYHLMRVALRLGLVRLNLGECDMLTKRMWASADMEREVREKVFRAISAVIELSGRPMSEIDFLLWSARQYCPEMTEPDCQKCVFDSVCKKLTHLFQPVFRTTNY